MKKFLAVYMGTEAKRDAWNQLEPKEREKREKQAFDAWMQWGKEHASVIVDQGAPLGKTKRAAPGGITDTKNGLTGYVIVKAESHEQAAKLFVNHPHFTLFPGDSVEIMECLPLPEP